MNAIKKTIENNLVHYFAGLSTADFIQKHIMVPLTDEQYNTIFHILTSNQRYFDALSGTKEQNEAIDIFIKKITNEIINTINH